MAKTIKKKILIVEDDKDFSAILNIKFTSEGFLVVSAQDGEEGAIFAEKEKPDLVLSDVLIPKMDGVSMGKKIKETNKNLPIIFLTNIKDQNYIDDINNLGFEYWVKSDLRINDIVKKVKSKLGIV